MNQSEYRDAVVAVLEDHRARVSRQLEIVASRIPPRTKKAIIAVYVDQDGEGFLDIRVHLDGPDLYVLQKSIADCASLFETKIIDAAMVPALPMMDASACDFSVQDTLADCAFAWVEDLWRSVDPTIFSVPVAIEISDGYGTKPPKILKK